MPYDSMLQRGDTPTYDSDSNVSPLIPEDVQREIVKNATEMSVVGRFARKRRMSRAQQRIPVLDTKPTAYFVSGDTGLKQTTDMAWRNVFLNAEEIAVIVPIPENLLADTDYDLWDEIRPDVEEAIAVALDAAVLFGTNKPSSWPTAIGPAAIAAGNTVTQGAGVDVAADINNVLASVEADGFDPDGIAMRQSLRASLRGLRTTTNEFIFKPGEPGAENTTFGRSAGSRDGQIFDIPARSVMSGVFEAEDAASANAVNLIAGDWDQVILGIRQDVTMKIFREGVIQDDSGTIIYNLMQQDAVAARFVARYAFAVPTPMSRLQTTTANRYPFGVLRMTA